MPLLLCDSTLDSEPQQSPFVLINHGECTFVVCVGRSYGPKDPVSTSAKTRLRHRRDLTPYTSIETCLDITFIHFSPLAGRGVGGGVIKIDGDLDAETRTGLMCPYQRLKTLVVGSNPRRHTFFLVVILSGGHNSLSIS